MNQRVLHKTTLTHMWTHFGAQCQNQLLFLFSTFFPIHHKIEFEFYSWRCQAHSSWWFPRRVSAACSQLYYTTFTCTNNLGFNGAIQASKSFVRKGFLPPPPQWSTRATKSHYKSAQASDNQRSIPSVSKVHSHWSITEERGRGQGSGKWGFLVLILSILCGFAELSYIPSNINSSFNNFA